MAYPASCISEGFFPNILSEAGLGGEPSCVAIAEGPAVAVRGFRGNGISDRC